MNWLSLSIAFNVLLALIAVAAVRWNLEHLGRSIQEELRLKDIIIIRERQLMAEKMKNITNLGGKTSIDTKTMSLLVLAVRSTNENEARSAAMQVCKRLKKNL